MRGDALSLASRRCLFFLLIPPRPARARAGGGREGGRRDGRPVLGPGAGPPAGPAGGQPAGQRLQVQRAGHPITLRLGEEAGDVALAVEDDGGGILPEDLPHIFEPFYRSRRARRSGVGGVGLGLAVARRIALAFGGSLVAESGPARGARFTLRLPLRG